jgi:amino acid transporter
MPVEGGLYQWAKLGFGEFAGFMVAWNLWVYAIILNSDVGINITTILAYSLGPRAHWMLESRITITVMNIVMMSAFTLVAIRGLSLGKWIQNLGGVILVIVLVAVIFLPFRNLALGRLAEYHPFRTKLPAFNLSTLNILGKMGFGALGGFEFMAIFAGETKGGGRAVGRSVLVAAPLIAVLFILGTSSVMVFTGANDLDLVSPISQALTRGTRPDDTGYSLIPLTILGLFVIRVAQACLAFTGTSRLPMVAGWDNLLPAWFTRLHPKWGTPVESVLVVGGVTLIAGLVGVAGVGRQEGYQLLQTSSGFLYAVTYLALFALPLLGRGGQAASAPWWLQVACVSGFLMTALYVILAAFPIIDVPSPLQFGAKLLSIVFFSNLLGAWIYWSYQRRLRRTALAAS